MTDPRRTALIAGVTGAVGGALARELAARDEWAVFGLSRRTPSQPVDGVTYVAADMNDPAWLRESFQSLIGVTHVYYCGRATHAEQVIEDAGANLQLLEHLINEVEGVAENLQHVHLVQGGKVYGVHVGPFPTPAQETDSRAPIHNFNYVQEDHLRRRSATASWSWTASRPNTLLHYSPAVARNLVSTLGAYAALCRELGCALDFPGPVGAFDSITQVTSLDLLARAIAWMSTDAACVDQAFNVTNTDVFRWRSLWSKLARAFEMSVGSVRPMSLQEVLTERDDVWARICERHKLAASTLSEVANWGYADATLERYWDEILSHNKIRQYGFHDWDNSEARFLQLLAEYRRARILPV